EYWRRPDETAASFAGEWFLTGDSAEMDAAGYIRYHGRTDDIMNAQGYRVSPSEVETTLLTFPEITEVAAIELPVREGVSIIAACIVGVPDDDRAQAILAHCQQNLARYKCPKAVIWLDALPRSANGKILRRKLIQDHGWRPVE
ncbi:MAG TPA: benzoate--CoA ligase, partial [Paracoccaceae bacterium]|nr:benzoate--CoA ligase [Paracoccaceae bacterium]